MNSKVFPVLYALLFGALVSSQAAPITCKEIAMLLRNGEDPRFVNGQITQRKLLQPLTPEEEKTLLSLHVPAATMTLLRDPANVSSPQAAAAYAAQVEQQKALALQAEKEDQIRQRQAENPQLSQAASARPAATVASQAAGQPLSLKFDAADGSQVDLAKMRGKVVLVDFWAMWCGPCMREVPNVVAAYQKYHAKGFEIVGISLDQSKADMLRVTAQKGMTWPQYFDGKQWDNAISASFRIHSIPTMWLVNKNGVVANSNAGPNLEGEIERLLAE